MLNQNDLAMTTIDKTKATEFFLAELGKWEQTRRSQDNGYDYEKSFVQMMHKVMCEVLEISTGDLPSNRNKKKLLTSVGWIEVPKNHVLLNAGGGFQISSYTQEMLCYLGQKEVFVQAGETMEKMWHLEVNPKQIERVCHHYGELLGQDLQEAIQAGASQEYDEHQMQQPHYVMADGAMFLTREEKWKEAKLVRIFNAQDHVELSKNRGYITGSQYAAHLGSYKEFIPKMEYYVDNLTNPVFIADGARWFWKWADSTYPDAVQILDFYHAAEHLGDFAKLYFKNPKKRTNWIEQQIGLLSKDGVKQVVSNIENLPPGKSTKTEQERKKLTEYYKRNQKRMRYKTFRDQGLLIGSGAIEAAHRHVMQQRLKLSGQRWTFEGLQQIANLRVAHKSQNWNKLVEHTKIAA